VPVFFFFVLWLNRKQLFVEGSDEPTAELEDEMGFLYGGYRKDLWWWECVELLRKLVLTGIIAIYKPPAAVGTAKTRSARAPLRPCSCSRQRRRS
jgi:hypothetical protein